MNVFSMPETLGELRQLINDEWRSLSDDTVLLRSHKHYDYEKGLDIDIVYVSETSRNQYYGKHTCTENSVPPGVGGLYFHNL